MSKRIREEDEKALEHLDHIVTVVKEAEGDSSPVHLLFDFIPHEILLPLAHRMLLTEVKSVSLVSMELRRKIIDVMVTLFKSTARDAVARLKAWGGWTWGSLNAFIEPLYNVCHACKPFTLEWFVTKVDMYDRLTEPQQSRLFEKLKSGYNHYSRYAVEEKEVNAWLANLVFPKKNDNNNNDALWTPSYWSVFVSVLGKASNEYWRDIDRNIEAVYRPVRRILKVWAASNVYQAIVWCLYVAFDVMERAQARPDNTRDLRDARIFDAELNYTFLGMATEFVIRYILVPGLPIYTLPRWKFAPFHEYWWPRHESNNNRILSMHHPNDAAPNATAFRFPTSRLFAKYLWEHLERDDPVIRAIATVPPRTGDLPERSWRDVYLPFSDYGPLDMGAFLIEWRSSAFLQEPDVSAALYTALAQLIYRNTREVAKRLIQSVQLIPHLRTLADFWPILEQFPTDRQAHQVYRNLATMFINDNDFPQLLTHLALDGDPILNPLKSEPLSLFLTLVNDLTAKLGTTLIDTRVQNIVALMDWEHPITHVKLPLLDDLKWWSHSLTAAQIATGLMKVEFDHTFLSERILDRLADLLVNGYSYGQIRDVIVEMFVQLPLHINNYLLNTTDLKGRIRIWNHSLGRVVRLLTSTEESNLFGDDPNKNIPHFNWQQMLGIMTLPYFEAHFFPVLKKTFNPLGLQLSAKREAFWDNWLKRQLSQ